MTSFRSPRRLFAGLAGSAILLAGALAGRADEPAKPERKDDALDRLLEKLENAPPAAQAKPASPDAKPGPEAAKPGESEPAKARPEAEPDGAKPAAGEVAPKDQALDSLLEKLGNTRDRPRTEDERKRGGPGPAEEKKDPADGPAPNPPDRPRPDELSGKAKDLDEHLERLTGRVKKKKPGEGEGQGQGGGEDSPLGEVIKRMREVEQRLGKPDTGEETRQKQAEIVKNLEQLIEKARSSSQSKQRSRMLSQQGQKPGSQQPGQTPGANPGGAPNTKPARPETKHAAVGGKDVWGHLPDELRQEMDNVSREVMLPSREELIRLYYLSVSKKSLSRED
jgi:hypothetical protein